MQAARAELEIGELELVGHVTQVAAAEAPVAAEYVPAPQSVQTVLAIRVAYFPAAQSVHTALPVTVLYLPATQPVHAPPLGPVKPTLHVQAVAAIHPLHDAPEFAGHATQVAASEEPTAVEYFPTPQLVQSEAAVVIEYVPATQLAHATLPVPCL